MDNFKKPTEHQVLRNNDFLDHVLNTQHLKNDAALARAIGVAPPALSKIRHGVLRVSEDMMVRIHELTDLPFASIRAFIPKRVQK